MKHSNLPIEYFSDRNPTLIHYNDEKGVIENWHEVFDKDYFFNTKSYHHVFSHHLANGGIQVMLEQVAIELGYRKEINKIKLLFKK